MSVDGAAFASVNQPQQQPMSAAAAAAGTSQQHQHQHSSGIVSSRSARAPQSQIHIARQPLSSPSPPPSQQQRKYQYPPQQQQQQQQYFPAGSIVELQRETGEQISDATVLLHDPVGDCIVVRLAPRSGRQGLVDVRYFNLAFVSVRMVKMCESGAETAQLDFKKVENRLQRNIQRADSEARMRRQQQQQQQPTPTSSRGGATASTVGASAAPPSTTSTTSRPAV